MVYIVYAQSINQSIKLYFKRVTPQGGGESTPYSVLYRDAPHERSTFLKLGYINGRDFVDWSIGKVRENCHCMKVFKRNFQNISSRPLNG